MSYHKVEYAHPTWLPVDGPEWRLVDEKGTMLLDPDGHPVTFRTEQDAVQYLEKKEIPLKRASRAWNL